MGLSQFDERVAAVNASDLGSGGPFNIVTIVAAATFMQRIDGVWLTNTDTIDHQVALNVGTASVAKAIIVVTVPATTTAFFGTTVEMLSSGGGVLASGVVLAPNQLATLQCTDTIGAGHTVQWVVQYGSF